MRHMKISPREDQNIWFTADTHFSHSNLIDSLTKWEDKRICRRYDSLKDHDQDLVKRINDNVKWNDILFHLGDWSFGGFGNIEKFRSQIHCENVHLVLGNHDQHIEANRENIQSLFSSVNDRIHLEYGKHDFILDHYPLETWPGIFKGWAHLFAHQHSSRIGPSRKIDIGIDKYGRLVNPYNINEIIETLNKISIKGGVGDSLIEVN